MMSCGVLAYLMLALEGDSDEVSLVFKLEVIAHWRVVG